MDKKNWDEIVLNFPKPHFLQTWEWGEVKEKYGWEKDFIVWKDTSNQLQAAAMILTRTLKVLWGKVQLRICYLPRGPLFMDIGDDISNMVLTDLQAYAHEHKAIFLKIDPEVVTHVGVSNDENEITQPEGIQFEQELRKRKWIFSSDQIQFRNTVMIDLRKSEDELLAAMKQKTRYNIRLAERKGVYIREAQPDDFPLLYQMYLETSVRDGFIIREQEYYLDVWTLFYTHDMARAFIAEVEGEAIAGLFLFYTGRRAWYFYGMSTDKHKEKMPNYLLQWEAMCFAKEKGCIVYDLWGAPDVFDETDRLWGVFRFKQGLGGFVQRSVGAWDYPARKLLYFLYQQVLPKFLSFTRKHRKKGMAGEISQDQ